jgi:hypothetical protein
MGFHGENMDSIRLPGPASFLLRLPRGERKALHLLQNVTFYSKCSALRLPRDKRKNVALALCENAHPGLLHSVRVAAAVSTLTTNRRADPETLSLYRVSILFFYFLLLCFCVC